MTLRTLKPKLATLSTSKVPMLNAKAGTTEMERGRAWMAKRDRVAARHGYKCAMCGRLWVSHRSTRADAAVAETRRQERAAVRALTKACAKARNDLQASDVLDVTDAGATRPPQATTGTADGEGSIRSCHPRALGNPTVPHAWKAAGTFSRF